jgi:prepilin-type N-terminal cleavage/methylation domain-containing protein
MTLVEVMVAMAIIAIVASICVSAFMMVIGSEMRETNTRLASEEAEERIATGNEPTTKMTGDLPLGDYTIPWTAVETYEEEEGAGDSIATENGEIDVSGDRSYTVIRDVEPEKLVFEVSVGVGDTFSIPTSGVNPPGYYQSISY